MSRFQKVSLVLLRLTLGWMFFYAGITKIFNPEWTAFGYLQGAKTFNAFYYWLSTPPMMQSVNFLNEWGLTLLGVSLLLGVFVRISAPLGCVLMALYYLVGLDFPYPNTHAFIVDEHVIYMAGLLVLSSFRSGRVWGFGKKLSKAKLLSKCPKLREWM